VSSKDWKIVSSSLAGCLLHIRSSRFIRNVAVVMTGTALAQVIGFCLTPVVSRLFLPSDFGIYGSFTSVAGILSAGITLQYTQAIMLPRKNRDAIHLLLVSCVSTLSISAIVLVLGLVFPNLVTSLLGARRAWILPLLVFGITITGLSQTVQAWCVRSKVFGKTSAAQVIRSGTSNSLQIGTGYLGMGSLGLILSTIGADLVTMLSLVRLAVGEISRSRRNLNWRRMVCLAKQYRDFPQYSASMSVISSLSLGLPVLLLNYFYGVAVGGAYAFSVRILSAPMSFLLTALRQVLFQRAAEAYNDKERLLPLYLKTTGGLLALALVPATILFLWSPPIFSLIFGAKWNLAGEFSSSLVIWLTFMFCNVPAVLFARILRIQRKIFLYDLSLLALRAAVLTIGGLYLTPQRTILAVSVVGAIMNVLFIILVGRIVWSKEANLLYGTGSEIGKERGQ